MTAEIKVDTYTNTIVDRLEHIELKDTGFYAIKHTHYVNNKQIFVKEYVSPKLELTEPGKIDNSVECKCIYDDKLFKIHYNIFNQQFKECVRKEPYGSYKLFDALKEYVISNPFTFAQNNNDYDILSYSSYDGHLRDTKQNILPNAIRFEFDDEEYDLSNLKQMLSKRSDIITEDAESLDEEPIYSDYEGEILGYRLRFIWTPSDNDWLKIPPRTRIDSHYLKNKFIKTILRNDE